MCILGCVKKENIQFLMRVAGKPSVSIMTVIPIPSLTTMEVLS